MGEAVRAAVRDGVLESPDGVLFTCRLCTCQLTGLTPASQHLAGRDHRRIAAKHLLEKPWLNIPSLVNLVSPDLLQAARDGVVRGFSCVPCGLDLSNVGPLEEHINGTDHAKVLQRQSIVGGLANLSLETTNNGNLPVDKAPPSVDLLTTNRCEICKVTCSGPEDLQKHLSGKSHGKKMMSISVMEQINNTQTFGLGSNRDTSLSSTTNPPSVAASHPQQPREYSQIYIPTPASTQTNPAKVTEHNSSITGLKNDSNLVCDLCDKTFTGQASKDEHLRSDKHKKKEQLSNIRPNDPTNIEFPWHIGASKLIPIGRYNMSSNIRGYVYVFNYIFKGKCNWRQGAENDSVKIRQTFTKLGYQVFVFESLSAEDTNIQLEKIRTNSSLEDVDSLIVFFLSHGTHLYTFQAEDGQELHMKKVQKKFLDSQCPQMKGKPKIFFANFCRGTNEQLPLQYDGQKEVLHDTITIYASGEGIMAARHEMLGTIFVNSLCKAMEEIQTKNIESIVNKVDQLAQSVGGTQTSVQKEGFREFHF